jgi:hypothetical protein
MVFGPGQSAFIFFIVLLLFFVFITVRGELPAWFGILAWSPVRPGKEEAPGASAKPPVPTHKANIGDVMRGAATPGDVVRGGEVADSTAPSIGSVFRGMGAGASGSWGILDALKGMGGK